MRLGALLGIVSGGAGPRALAEQARRYVGEGYTSLWSAQAVGRGIMVTDPFVALSVAATVAEEVAIGTAVLQVPLYHPVELAHRVLSLQQICGDRLLLGVGSGSTATDFAAFGRPFESRFRVLRENVEALRSLFATGVLGEVNLSPWPEVRGGPKLFLGSWGGGVERAAHAYDGWIASARYREVDEVCAALVRYRNAGGARAVVSTIMVGANTDLGALREKLQIFADAGFDDAVVALMSGAPAPATIRALID